MAGRPRPPVSRHDVSALVGFLAVAAAVDAVGTVVAVHQIAGWYSRVPHVTWTPPEWAFAVTWGLLYAVAAVAGWLVWLRRDLQASRAPLALFVTQLAVNAIWAPVLFIGYPMIGGAALWLSAALIVLLDLLIGFSICSFWPVSRTAALLLVPCLAWTLYVSAVDWGDAVLLTSS